MRHDIVMNLIAKPICVIFVVLAALTAGPATAQVPATLTHEGFLNWDITVGVDLNDFEIVVENANYIPNQTFNGPFGAPTVTPSGANTQIRWSGAPVAAGTTFHIGLDMAGGGQILSATATLDGNPVANVPIPFELTEIRPPAGPGIADVFMVFNTPQGFFDDNPLAVVTLENVRTFIDLPAALLDLADLNSSLDLNLLPNETVPVPNGVLLNAPGAETEIFVGVTNTPSPLFESLLYGQVFVDLDGTGPSIPEMTSEFWNLNPQSPEPTSLTLLALGGLMFARRPRCVA